MSGRDDDEAEERRRQARERATLTGNDIFYDAPKRKTRDGSLDSRSKRRTGRVVSKTIKMHPRNKALFDKIRDREGMPSDAILFEELLKLYQEHHGAVEASELPTDEELAEGLVAARDETDR